MSMDIKKIRKLVRAALREDVGRGDITTGLTIPADCRAEGKIVFREEGVLCGLAFARETFRMLDPRADVQASFKDGDLVPAGKSVAVIRARTRAMLTGERVALNFLTYLSAISTQTRRYCDAVRPTRAIILDTRKTTPGLRELERYAVRTGDGVNHRFDLGEMVLVKDNHRAKNRFKTLAELVSYIRRKTHKPVEVEVDHIEELSDVLSGHPDMVLLDNMSPAQLRRCVRMVKALPPSRRPLLEASGGVNLQTVRTVARTGVDRISVGALTHSRRAIDVSLEVVA